MRCIFHNCGWGSIHEVLVGQLLEVADRAGDLGVEEVEGDGAAGSLDGPERRAHWQKARGLYAESLAVWQDMQKRGILTAEDRTKPEEVTAEIARCDAALRRLAA